MERIIRNFIELTKGLVSFVTPDVFTRLPDVFPNEDIQPLVIDHRIYPILLWCWDETASNAASEPRPLTTKEVLTRLKRSNLVQVSFPKFLQFLRQQKDAGELEPSRTYVWLDPNTGVGFALDTLDDCGFPRKGPDLDEWVLHPVDTTTERWECYDCLVVWNGCETT